MASIPGNRLKWISTTLCGIVGFCVAGSILLAASVPARIIRTNPPRERVYNLNASRCEFPQSIDITFDKDIDPSSLTLDNIFAVPQGEGCAVGQIKTAGVCLAYDPCLDAAPTYSKQTRTASIHFVLTEGIVFVYVNAGMARCGANVQLIRGADGQIIDGDGDGKPGGSYVFSYKVVNGPRAATQAPRKKK
ncbi:MAG: hypothetical protein PHX83_11085 [Acidobacteriia bacterium]|nr:hypothetical protein [Terriglobia bacterium]